MANTTKLDMYHYNFNYSNQKIDRIDIKMRSSNDIEIADIASSITGTDGLIYVEGRYFRMKSMNVNKRQDSCVYLEINVEEIYHG